MTGYDESKFTLGPLCKRGHRWQDTDQSLRYRSTRQCVECHKAWSANYRGQYYQDNAERIRAKAREYHHANRGEILAKQAEYRKTESFRQSIRRHQLRNRESLYERTRHWRRRNKQHVSEYNHQYYSANVDYEKVRRREYQKTHKAQIARTRKLYLQRNQAVIKERHSAWARSDRGRLSKRINQSKRLARKRNLPDTFTPLDWERCLGYWHGCCAVCGRPAGLWHTIAADHWIPLSSPDCPGTVPTNIVPLCHAKKDGEGSCNVSKRDRDPAQWLVEYLEAKKAAAKLAEIESYFDWTRQSEE